jgi:protein-S-isoprenylcysteine O-methyltransferase Ste14
MPLSRIRVPLGFVVGTLVLVLATPALETIVIGLPIALLGLGFRAVAAGVIRKNRSLAVVGPYRFTRNPLYFGSFLLAAGFGLMSGNLLSLALLLVPFAAIYWRVIRAEEVHLAELFGKEYEQFKSQVPRFFPLRFGEGLLESFSTRQYVSNREYNAAIGFVAATTVLLLKYLVASR